MGSRVAAVASLLCAVTLVGASARAQVLHERVNVGAAGRLPSPPSAAASGPQPKEGEQVYAPQPDRQVEAGGGGGNPPVEGDQPPERRDLIRPDRDTGPEGPGKHFYHEVFNPAVFPFKRMTALDDVKLGECTPAAPDCKEEQLAVFDRRLRAVPVGGRRSDDRDAFWGSIVLDLEPGRWAPIPSVASGVRVLSYQTTPKVELAFARDSADNLFVRSVVGGRHRLNWLTDAPVNYFAGELPRAVRLGDEPAELQRAVPELTRRRVRQFLEHTHMRADKSAPLARILDPLVNYFRAFEVGDLPASCGSTYLDLALAQKGCCRHRSYAFAITAMALGIPTRYVENELHVYVEVFVPQLGWRRINLGGATLDEEVLGAEGKTPYEPRGEDPFPEPPAYTKNAQPPPKQLAAARNGGSTGGGSTSGGGAGSGSGSGGAIRSVPLVDLDAIERASANEPTRAARAQTQISVELGARSSFRGETVEVSGAVRATGAEPAGLHVELYLESAGGAVRVGEATTAPDGSYRATIDVPRNLPLGDHRLIARTPGDEKRAPSSTRK